MTQTLHIERKMADKSAIMRAMRALAGIDQREAAAKAGLSLRTLVSAESGKCSASTWNALTAVYKAMGFNLAALPLLDGQLVHVIAVDPESDAIEVPKEKPKRRKKNTVPTH